MSADGRASVVVAVRLTPDLLKAVLQVKKQMRGTRGDGSAAFTRGDAVRLLLREAISERNKTK